MFAVLFTILEFLIMALLQYIRPESEIDTVREFNSKKYNQKPSKFGNHELRVSQLADQRNFKSAFGTKKKVSTI